MDHGEKSDVGNFGCLIMVEFHEMHDGDYWATSRTKRLSIGHTCRVFPWLARK